jgi:hypothetical protein
LTEPTRAVRAGERQGCRGFLVVGIEGRSGLAHAEDPLELGPLPRFELHRTLREPADSFGVVLLAQANHQAALVRLLQGNLESLVRG